MSNTKDNFLVVIAGPTASGKTKLSLQLAQFFQTVIINADSRQFYKELQIGTAPPTNEDLQKVKHYFVQNLSIHDYYNVSKYENDVLLLLNELFETYKIIFLVGGSGLYIDAVCKGIDDMPEYDPELRANLIEMLNEKGIEWLRALLKQLDPDTYNRIDLKNKNRVLRAIEVSLQTGLPYSSFLKRTPKKRPFNIIKIAINKEREKLYADINSRVDEMIKAGLVNEALSLYKYKHLTPLKTVGYKELFDFIENKITLDEAIDLIKRNTRKYARKQLTWFRRDKEYKWFDSNDLEKITQYIFEKVNEKNFL